MAMHLTLLGKWSETNFSKEDADDPQQAALDQWHTRRNLHATRITLKIFRPVGVS